MQVKIEKDALSLLHCLSVISPLNFNSIIFFWFEELIHGTLRTLEFKMTSIMILLVD